MSMHRWLLSRIASAVGVIAASACMLEPESDPEPVERATQEVTQGEAACGAPGTMAPAIAEIPNNNGTMCTWTSSSTKKCVSVDQRRPIGASQAVACDATLYWCTATAGSLSGCTSTSASNDWCQDDACVCTGVLDCANMIAAKACGDGCMMTCTHGMEFDSLVCSCGSPDVTCT